MFKDGRLNNFESFKYVLLNDKESEMNQTHMTDDI